MRIRGNRHTKGARRRVGTVRDEVQLQVLQKLQEAERLLQEALSGQLDAGTAAQNAAVVDADDPPVFLVVEQGRRKGLFCYQDVERWRGLRCDVLVDLTTNNVHYDVGGRRARTLSLTSERGLGSLLKLLRKFAERPGQYINPWVSGWDPEYNIEPKTLTKYVERLRMLLAEYALDAPLIVKDSVDWTVSQSGWAYRANPEYHWRLIRYCDPLAVAKISAGTSAGPSRDLATLDLDGRRAKTLGVTTAERGRAVRPPVGKRGNN
jgi:hypothetical protein